MTTMIADDPTRTVPTTWTNDDLIVLWHHASDLARNGSPVGYLMQMGLFPFCGVEEGEARRLRGVDEWDYQGMRAWVGAHPDEVTRLWQLVVRYVW